MNKVFLLTFFIFFSISTISNAENIYKKINNIQDKFNQIFEDTKRYLLRRDLTKNQFYLEWIQIDVKPLRCSCEYMDWGGGCNDNGYFRIRTFDTDFENSLFDSFPSGLGKAIINVMKENTIHAESKDKDKNYVYTLEKKSDSYYKLQTSGLGQGNTRWECLDYLHSNYNFAPIKYQY